ncbi:hypothetical protein C942_00488 [Photobacterium marinum]|uniref:Uncharacterized protein n=1 Tax=Photobacterium marinum TaxID=1056511 RepID=L8JB58_9GAMM|nr:hypothetical protein [Photobacterium marinum]ELR66046.1 hypothetical protein C942_00488 [Photobacterium marinum]
MKELIDAILSRMKSPILGSFCLIYALYHIKEIGVFIWSKQEVKLQLLHQFEFNYNELIMFFFVAFCYVVILEWLQFAIDYLVKKSRYFRDKLIHEQNVELAKLKHQASNEYQSKLAEKELESYSDEKKEFEKKIEQLEKLKEHQNDMIDGLTEEVNSFGKYSVINKWEPSYKKLSLLFDKHGIKKVNGEYQVEMLASLDQDKRIPLDKITEIVKEIEKFNKYIEKLKEKEEELLL